MLYFLLRDGLFGIILTGSRTQHSDWLESVASRRVITNRTTPNTKRILVEFGLFAKVA